MNIRWPGETHILESLAFRHKPWITVFLKDKKGTNLCILSESQSQKHLAFIKMTQPYPIRIADATQLELRRFPSLFWEPVVLKARISHILFLQVKILLDTQKIVWVFLFLCKTYLCINEGRNESDTFKWQKEKRRGHISWSSWEKLSLGVLQLPKNRKQNTNHISP